MSKENDTGVDSSLPCSEFDRCLDLYLSGQQGQLGVKCHPRALRPV